MEKFILDLLIESGELLLKKQQGAQVEHKSEKDLVTDADKASERLIVDKILKRYPEHKIYAEESKRNREDLFADDCWVIDPLDGTNNYAYGFPIWGVSIAYAKNGEVIVGGVAFPTQGIYLMAVRGEGARQYIMQEGKLESKKILVSKRSELKKAMMVICHAPHTPDAAKNLDSLGKISQKVFNVRNLGAAVYNIGYVAMGLSDACVEFRLQPYDGAAGLLLVQEAGGRVSDLEGNDWKLDSPSMVATNDLIHKDLLEALKIGKDL
jgi:myo-inositol-1(or 4)-monophosphatase